MKHNLHKNKTRHGTVFFTGNADNHCGRGEKNTFGSWGYIFPVLLRIE